MAEITILNDIVHEDFQISLNIQRDWGLSVLDLRGSIFGKSLLQLTDEETERAARCIDDRGMSVYCLSSSLFFDDLEKGEDHFRENHLGRIERLAQIAGILQPKLIRLLSARFREREEFDDSIPFIMERYPWLIPMYQEAVDRLAEAGFRTTIENEIHRCILSNPKEIVDFFEALQRGGKADFTFDVQNLWKMGTFPTMETYRLLSPLIGYFHLKGGMTGENGTEIQWSSSLEDASWPVKEMTRQVVRDGVSGVICLNPSHGEVKPGYDYHDIHKRNVDFLRREIPGIV